MDPSETLQALEAPPPPVRAPPADRRPASRSLAAAGAAVACLCLLPAAYLLARASTGRFRGALEVLGDARTLSLLVRTCVLTAAVTAAATAIGVFLAWVTSRTDLPARGLWLVLAVLPLAVPSYVGAYSFVSAFGPRGLLQSWLAPLGVQRLPEIYGFGGAWLVLSLLTYPYVLLTVRAGIAGLDPALEDVSRTLGRSGAEAFRTLVVPQLRPSIASGALLVALYTLHDFGAVSILRFDSFTRAIYLQYQASFDRTPAAVLGLVLVAMTLVVLAAEIRTRGRAAYHRARPSRPPAPAALGPWRRPVIGACAFVVVLALGVPVGVSVYWFVRGVVAGEPLRLAGPLASSLQASAIGAAATLFAAWPVAVLAARHPGKLSRFVERASFVGYALPGLVVALSLVFFGIRLAPRLYQTRTMLTFAYVVMFLPQTSGALRASLLQIPRSLEDAARTLGSRRVALLVRVVLPLVRPGLQAGYVLVFLTVMKELPATLLLAPTGFQTLATRLWSATSEALYARAAAPALALMIAAAVPVTFLALRETGGKGSPSRGSASTGEWT